jgi:MATE family multidrug resistance protein
MATLTTLVWGARRGRRGAARAPARAVDWRGLAAVLRVGLPIGIATLAEVGVWLGATIYAATLGAADVAAHTLTLRLAGVAYAVPAALLQASMVRMARAETLGDPALRRAVTTSSLTLSLSFGIGLCVLIVLGAAPLAHGVLGGNETGLVAAGLAVNLLMLLGVMECLLGPGSAAAGLLRGRKDTRMPMLYSLVGQWAVGVPIVICLCEGRGFGIAGVWIGLSVGTLLTTVLMLWRLRARP